MGWRVSFRLGPFRYSEPIRRKPTRPASRSASSAQAREMRDAARELREAREAALAAIPPPTSFPQPAPYVYYKVTAVRSDGIDLVSDDGERWDGVRVPAESAARIEVGARFTWDGESMENYVPPSLHAEIRQQAQDLNSLPAQSRIRLRGDAFTVQTYRQFGYVFDENNKLVPAGNARH